MTQSLGHNDIRMRRSSGHDDVKMGMKQKFDVETCGTERKLTIKKCTKGDEASYTCLSPDNRRTTAELFIKMPVFKIEKDLENMEVMMGDAVKMVVKLSTERLEF